MCILRIYIKELIIFLFVIKSINLYYYLYCHVCITYKHKYF